MPSSTVPHRRTSRSRRSNSTAVGRLCFAEVNAIPISSNQILDRFTGDSNNDPWHERTNWISYAGIENQMVRDAAGTFHHLSSDAQSALLLCDAVFGVHEEVSSNVDDVASSLGDHSSAGSREVSSGRATSDADTSNTSFASESLDQSASRDLSSLPTLDSAITSREDSDSLATDEIHLVNMHQTAVVQAGPPTDPTITAPTSARATRETHENGHWGPGMQCPFHFLRCGLHFFNRGLWEEHAAAHLKRVSPPGKSRCMDCKASFGSWGFYLEHLWEVHQGEGRLASHALDPQLLIHLRNKRIVEIGEYQVLMAEGRLGGNSAPFSMMHNPGQERRRLARKDRPQEVVVMDQNGQIMGR